MRQNHIISLLQSGFTTIQCIYDLTKEDWANTKSYTFKTILSVNEGDLVVVPNGKQGNMKVVRVVTVHNEPKLDLDADFDYAWVVSKVDVIDYVNILAQEEKAGKQLLSLEAQKRKAEVLDGLKGAFGDDVQNLNFQVGALNQEK